MRFSHAATLALAAGASAGLSTRPGYKWEVRKWECGLINDDKQIPYYTFVLNATDPNIDPGHETLPPPFHGFCNSVAADTHAAIDKNKPCVMITDKHWPAGVTAESKIVAGDDQDHMNLVITIAWKAKKDGAIKHFTGTTPVLVPSDGDRYLFSPCAKADCTPHSVSHVAR